MAIKNKNLMMSLTESLNENKKQEIANFKKLKEATEDNVSYVRYLLDTAEDMDDVQQAIYQIDDGVLENEVQLMFDSCSEDDPLEEVISLVVSTMEDNAEYDEEMNESEIDDARKDSIEKGLVSEDENNEGSDGNYKPIIYADFDFEEGSLIDKNFGDDYEDATYEGYWIDIYYKGTRIGRVFKEISDGWVMYIELDYDGVDKAFEGIVPDIRGSRSEDFKTDSSYRSVKAFLNSLITKMGSSLDFDAPTSDDIDDSDDLDESDNSQDEPNEDDRKNTLIAKKDELEARLGDILQSIRDKQMDTEEFRKLSREAADLDSQIMDLDNQIRGVYESVNEAELFNMDVYKDLEDEDENVDVEKLKLMQDYVVRKTKEIINYVYYYAPYSGIGDNILNDMLNVIKESLPNMNESINESDEDVKKGIVDQLVSAGMTKEQAEQTANGICNIFKNKVGSNQVVNEDDSSDNSLNNIVWDNIEDYDDSEKEEIRNILQNLDFEVTGIDGHSVSIKLKQNGMVFWIDYSDDGSDIVGDWNQYIFDTTNSEDRIRKAIQTSYYEDTGDTIALEPMESAGFEYLENKGIIKGTGKGYSFTDINESVNQDGFPNSDELQKYFIGLSELPDEVEIDNVKYKMEQYGGSGDNCYAIYTDINNNDSYIKVFYSLNKTENGSYKGISKINGVSDLRESAKPIKEAAITEKNLLKSQGNVYMFECKGNSDFSHIVGENYNEEENTLENVETYNNKEDADKDYLGRCEITKEGTDINESSDDNKAEQLISTLKKELPGYDWDYRFEDDQIVFYDKNEDFDFSNIDVNYEKVDDIIKSIFGKESYVDAQTPVIGVVAQ